MHVAAAITALTAKLHDTEPITSYAHELVRARLTALAVLGKRIVAFPLDTPGKRGKNRCTIYPYADAIEHVVSKRFA